MKSTRKSWFGPWLVYVGVAAAWAAFLAVMDARSRPATGLGFTGYFLVLSLAIMAAAEGTELLLKIFDRPRRTPPRANGS